MTGASLRRPLFYWCHSTWREPFETGVQRVTRRLGRALADLGVEIVPVGLQERQRLLEVIGHGPTTFEAALASAGRRPLLLVPDITAEIDVQSLARASGLRTLAMVHDLIPVKLAGDYDPATVVLYEKYFRRFGQADAVLATTRYVADQLRDFLGEPTPAARPAPPIHVVSLPAQFGDRPRSVTARRTRPQGAALKLVGISAWEPRKNLPRLLRAFAQAQERTNHGFELTLVGRRGLFPAFDAEVSATLAKTPRAIYAGMPDDAALAALIAGSDATVYPSFEEGFGLPIQESLWLGTPCLSHGGSAMAEVAPGGGTLMIDMRDETALADALVDLATRPDLLRRLGEEALRRPLASWADYAAQVLALCDALGCGAAG